MAEPKKKDIVEQYIELQTKRKELERAKQAALMMGAADVVPGVAGAKGAVRARKASGAAEEALGVASKEQEAAISGLEEARRRRAETSGSLSSGEESIQASFNQKIPDPSVDYYQLLMDENPHLLTSPFESGGVGLFFKKDFVSYAKAKAKLRFLKEAQEQFRAKIADDFGGLSPAQVDDIIKSEGMNPAFLRAEGPSADWIKSMEKQTGISWDELVEREGGRPDLRALTEEADSELRSAAQAFEQRQEEYADLLLARGQGEYELPLAKRFSDAEKIRDIEDLFIDRYDAMRDLEEMEKGSQYANWGSEYNKMVPEGETPSDYAAYEKKKLALKQKIIESKKNEVNELTNQLKESLADYPTEQTFHARPNRPYIPKQFRGKKDLFEETKRHSRRTPHGSSLNPFYLLESGGERAIQKADAFGEERDALRALQRETHKQHWSNLRDEAKARQIHEKAKAGRATQEAATKVSAEEFAKARAMAGLPFVPLLGAAHEWREADKKLESIDTQMRTLYEGASPEEQERIDDWMLSGREEEAVRASERASEARELPPTKYKR